MHKFHPSATIEALLSPADSHNFYTSPHAELDFNLEQNTVSGDLRHGGFTRTADMRAPAYTRGQDIVLNRQSVSIVGAEDLDFIADSLELSPEAIVASAADEAQLDQETALTLMAADLQLAPDALIAQPSRITRLFLTRCLGANILLGDYRGTVEAPEFRDIGRGVDVGPYDQGRRKFTDASIMITRPNEPCHHIGKETKERYPVPLPDLDKTLIRFAQGRRGFVGMIAKGGKMAVGQSVHFIPLGK